MARLVQRLGRQESTRRGRRLGTPKAPVAVAAQTGVSRQLAEIIDGDATFRLRKPLEVTVRREGPYIVMNYEPLGIEEYGKTELAALEAFAYHFGALWEGIAQANDRKLTSEARELKQALRSLVEAVSSSRP